MSAVTRLGVVGGTLTGTAVLAGLSSQPAVREYLSRYAPYLNTKHTWRILALLFALLNFKNLPFVWHIRVLRGILYQLYFQRQTQQPQHLFAPMITSSRNSFADCDYQLHKSNSTYFADLDVARANFMGCIVRLGLAKLNKGDEEGLPSPTTDTPGKYFIALGGVSCFFHREIAPFQSYEIYTRLLSWDRKWIYCVSHIVKPGVAKPVSYALQPWKKSKRKPSAQKAVQEEDMTKHIFATSVARYVFKKGRKTINPEIVLQRSRLLPSRPAGVDLPPRAERSWTIDPESSTTTKTTTTAGNGSTGYASAFQQASTRLAEAKKKEAIPNDDDGDGDDGWTWDDMEQERLRGLRIASHFDALGAAQMEFRAEEVLGKYGDYW